MNNEEGYIKSSISSELNGILNGGSPPVQNYRPHPVSRSNGLDYIEPPTLGSSESIPAGVSSSPVDMIPVDDDMSERIKRVLQEERGMALQETPQQMHRVTPQTHTEPQNHVASNDIPKDFDFDLFHMATLKDIVGTLNTIIENTEDKLNKLKEIKAKIEKNVR